VIIARISQVTKSLPVPSGLLNFVRWKTILPVVCRLNNFCSSFCFNNRLRPSFIKLLMNKAYLISIEVDELIFLKYAICLYTLPLFGRALQAVLWQQNFKNSWYFVNWAKSFMSLWKRRAVRHVNTYVPRNFSWARYIKLTVSMERRNLYKVSRNFSPSLRFFQAVVPSTFIG